MEGNKRYVRLPGAAGEDAMKAALSPMATRTCKSQVIVLTFTVATRAGMRYDTHDSTRGEQ
jgi:hypothetical protein